MNSQNPFDCPAQCYDLFELKSKKMYESILEILDKHFVQLGTKTVLDFACGTGAQTIPLAQKGYAVTACDISPAMVEIGRQKMPPDIQITWKQGDMRYSKMGQFDAVIAMFNAVGYLSPSDFITALRNIREHLSPSGLFIFDNTNLDAVRSEGYISGKMIDTAGEYQGVKFVRFCQSTIDLNNGRFTTDWDAYVQEGLRAAARFTGTWQRQIYTCAELEQILSTAGFKILKYYDRYGGEFIREKTFSVVIVSEL